jgi:hypothetical protein
MKSPIEILLEKGVISELTINEGHYEYKYDDPEKIVFAIEAYADQFRPILTPAGNAPDSLDKDFEYLFWVWPETVNKETQLPFPLLVIWLFGDINDWKVVCSMERSIKEEIGNYTLHSYMRVPNYHRHKSSIYDKSI